MQKVEILEKIEEIEKDMTPKLIKDLGFRFATEKSTQKVRYGLYECQYCGGEFECKSNNVNTGNTKSCGCLRKLQKIKHGLRCHRFYRTWNAMIHRCTNPSDKNYKDYGARGITVCEEWLDVVKFITWADKTYIKGYTLDRIDNDKGYSPENCRWADASTQAVNQRKMKNNTSGFVGITWDKNNKNWRVTIQLNKDKVNLGSFKTKEEAVLARDNYIIENNLPHKLSTQY